MTEYDPHEHDHGGGDHDLTPPVDLPEHDGDDRFDQPHEVPLDDFGSHAAPAPDALHFPGDDMTAHDDSAPDTVLDTDPSAPYPDDSGFSDWLSNADVTGPDDDPAADDDLRDQLATPPEHAGDLPTSDSLVDWTLRRI